MTRVVAMDDFVLSESSIYLESRKTACRQCVFIIERSRGKGCDACFSMLNVKGRVETLVVEDCWKIG